MARALDQQETEDELAILARSLLRGEEVWQWRRAGMWIYLTPTGPEVPAQGWKLHIAATVTSALPTLEAIFPILLREQAPFKFAATQGEVARLNAVTAPRELAGKFVTVYPRDDQQALRLADAVDRATAGFRGPVILSDRPVRPGSVVHYRYGAFREDRIIDDDGSLVDVIRDPEGKPVPDERRPWFSPPSWAQNPFTSTRSSGSNRSRASPEAAGPVLLNGRYVAKAAFKHANKGGVYLAEDRCTGGKVVLKEGRPHVEDRSRVGDVVSAIRREARILGLLAELGRTPRVLEVFEQQDHVFLALEYLGGPRLREYIALSFVSSRKGLSRGALVGLVRRLAETMQAIHGAGVVIRDFTPNNLYLLPGEEVRLADLELAHALSDGPVPCSSVGTPGYASPQQFSGDPSGLPDDYYSLGATIAYAATGADPYLIPDFGAGRSSSNRLEEWLLRLQGDGLMDPDLIEIILGCTADDPSERWGPQEVLEGLKGSPPRPGHGGSRHTPPPPLSPGRIEHVAADIGRWLGQTIQTEADHLWPTTTFGLTLDPCNVQTGASGVGLFLCEAGRLTGDPAMRELVFAASSWVGAKLASGPRRPPGLYFGLSGAVWFLAAASALLEDPALLEQATDLALSLPTHSFNPDVTHGTAGIGLGQLHHWAVTGDDRFVQRAARCAKHLEMTVEHGASGVVWPVPEDVKSDFAGLTSYGFAHGNAGIAYFLLCAASALGDARYLELALDAVETLLAVAIVDADTAFWEAGPGRPGPWPHWCNGSSGVGTTLIRAYAVTGDHRYREMAELAAGAVERVKWRSSPVQCHGLAGNGEFLLDMRDFIGEQRFHKQAMELAEAIYAHRAYRNGLVVFPDDSGGDVTAPFNVGLSGVGSFFLRLVRGTPRPLMLDQLIFQPSGVTGS